jgi:hypothetical protein
MAGFAPLTDTTTGRSSEWRATGGHFNIPTTQSQAVGQLLNVGASDASVTYTVAEGVSTAGQGYRTIEYIQRAGDRSTSPASA